MKNHKAKKILCLLMAIFYLISYILQSFSYADFGNKVYAAGSGEDQIGYTNIVAILVDNSIYNSLQDDIEWYSQTYLQGSTSTYQGSTSSGSVVSRRWNRVRGVLGLAGSDDNEQFSAVPKANINQSLTAGTTNYNKYNAISNSKAIILPIDTDNLTAPEITKILENLYFDGIQGESSNLVGVILIGDIPLPVVNQFGYVFPTIYPYVDFEDQKFVWDGYSQYFVYNDNPKGQAELWHGRIKFDTIQEYKDYFDKLQDYASNPSDFVGKNIWYDDFVGNKTYFYEDGLNAYINNFLFAEDLGYRRFSDLMIAIMQGEHNEAVSNVLERLGEVLSGTSYTGNYASGMEAFLSTPELGTPTMTIRKILYEGYVKPYTSLLGVKYMDTIRNNIETANRWVEHYTGPNDQPSTRDAMDTHYIKIEQKDETLLRSNEGLDPLIISINNVLEEFVDDKVDDEKYRLNEVIPLTYLEYEGARNDWSTCTRKKYDAFENYFFGKQAKYLTTMQDVSTYRGTYRNYQGISGLTMDDIQNSQQPSTDLDIDLSKKSVGGSYEIFAQQVDANRGHNTNNTITELDLYEQNKTAARDEWSLQCEKKFLGICRKKRKWHYTTHKDSDGNTVFTPESPQGYAIRNWGGASPLNLDENMDWASGYNFQDAVTPVYDIGGSQALTSPEYKANSFQGVNEYTRLVQRKFVVQAYKKNGNPRKKFWFKNKAQLNPDSDGRGYNSSMGEDILFTNLLPSFTGDDGDDIDQDDTGFNRVYTDPKLASSVNFFTTYSRSDITQRARQGNVIKLAKRVSGPCKGHGQIYTYKTLDSRVKNTATNITDIGGRTYKAFQDVESPLYQLYDEILEKIDNLNNELANSPTSTSPDGTGIVDNLQSLINTISGADSTINSIINTSDSTISGWTDTQISQHATAWSNAFDASTWQYIDDTVEDIELSFQEIDNFFEYFSFEDIYDYIYNKQVEFTINGRNLILLQSWKENILYQLASTHNTYASQSGNLHNRVNTAENKYDALEDKLDDTLFKNENKVDDARSDLNHLLDDIDKLPGGCDGRYASLCTAINSVRYYLNTYGKDVAGRIKGNESLIESNRINGIDVFYITKYKKSGKETGKKFKPFNEVGSSTDTSEEGSSLTSLIQILAQIPTTTDSGYEIQVEGMNITTPNRPIDSPKYMTFKGIGGDKVTFIYPDLYKVEVYTGSNEKLTLLDPDDIADNIRDYLRAVVKKYNSYLTGQQAKAQNYYNQNSNAYNLLNQLDPMANPNHVSDNTRPYGLFDEDYLINLLVDKMNDNTFFSGNMGGYEPIEFLAHMMYYQNIMWPERIKGENIQDDMDKIRESFDINQKISHIFDNYIISDHNSGSFITPGYRDDGYEVAYINSDENDYIVYEVTSPFMESLKSSSANFKKPSVSDIEKSQLEEELVNECNIPEDGEGVLLFDLKTMSSPWLDAIKCRREKLREKPMEFSISISLGSAAFGVTRNGATGGGVGYTGWSWNSISNSISDSFSDISDSVMSQIGINYDSNGELLNNLSALEYEVLSKIDKYVKFTTPLTTINADDAKATIKISSSVDLDTLYIHVINVGETKMQMYDKYGIVSQNITQGTTAFSTGNISVNPFDTQTFNLNFINPKEGSNVVAFFVCPSANTDINRCIKKTLTLYVVPGAIQDFDIQTLGDTVMQGSQLPIKVTGIDGYGNDVGQLLTERFTISTSAGTLVHQSTRKSAITFSDFNEADFILDASGVSLGQPITLTVSGPIGDTTIQKTKSINVVKGKLNISFSGANTTVGSNSNSSSINNSYSAAYNSSSMSSNNMASNSVGNFSASATTTAPSMSMGASSMSASSANPSNAGLSASQGSSYTSNSQSNVLSPNNMNINITLPDENIYSYVDEFNITQANTNAIPKLSLRLSDQNGNTLTNIDTIASITSKRSLTSIGRITEKIINKNTESGTFPIPQYKFAQATKFDIKSGVVDVYLLPKFKAGNDTIYISIPGIDPIQVNINVLPASAKVVTIKTSSENIRMGSSVAGNIQIYDSRDNLVTRNVTLRVGITGPMGISGFTTDSQLITVNGGSKDLIINSKDKGGIGYIYAMIDGTGLANQKAGYKKLTVQDTILPKDDLNIMYLNLYGSDWGNQRGYLSDNNEYIQYLISHSNRLLTTTTLLVTPNKLKEFAIAIDQSLNVANLADENVYLKLDDDIHIGVENIGSFVIPSSSFILKSISVSEENQDTALQTLINTTPGNKNLLVYIPDIIDSEISSNEMSNNKIEINGDYVLDFNAGTQSNSLGIYLGNEFLSGYQVWDVSLDDTHVGKFILVQKTGYDIYLDVQNLGYDYGNLWLKGSTNRPGIGIYKIDSMFDDASLGYHSIQDSIDPDIGIGFTAEFKNITNFGAGQPVGEATIPFSSEFLINIGDPLLKRIDDNESAKAFNADGSIQEDTKFDKGLGELIYSDPTKTIHKVINIDFNNDDLEDIIVIYSDGNVKLLKNYGGTNPFRDMGPLMVLADRIKDVVTGDVDGNGYEDLIIWTESNVLRVYHNYDGIFEVDGYPICININVHAGEISQTPSRVEGLLQIFFEDMDNDGSMDIVTNDKLGFVKIFYGGKNNSFNQDNYVSTNQYMCDENRYQRLSNGATAITQANQSVGGKLFNNVNTSNLSVASTADEVNITERGNDETSDNSADSVTISEFQNSGLPNHQYSSAGNFTATNTPNNTWSATSQSQQDSTDTQPALTAHMSSSNENIVHRFAAKVNSQVEVLDESYFRRAGINPNEEVNIDASDLGIDTGAFAPEDTGGIEKMKLSQIKQKFNIQGKLEQATNFDVGAAINIYSQINRYKVALFGVIPAYESGVIDENNIQYVPIGRLTEDDPVKVYKKYMDVNGDVLEDGDKVEVTVTIQATQNMTGTFIDNISGPWIIPVDEELDMIENFRFESGTVTPYQVNNEFQIHRDLDNARYMIDNIGMRSGDIIKLHYRLYYEGVDIMDISLKDLNGNNYKQFGGSYMTNHPEDGLLDIQTQPTDGCNPSMYAFFNQGTGADRSYQLEYVDLGDLMSSITSSNQQNYDEAIDDLTSSMVDVVGDDGKVDTSGIPGMSSILESPSITDMFAETFSLDSILQDNGVDLSNIANIPNQLIDALLGDITDKIMSFVSSSCGGFSLKSLLGITSCNTYIPFNESFLGAGDYHIFGCFNIPPLTALIGDGMPLLNIPGNRSSPYGYLPFPGLFGYPFKGGTDQFSFGNDGGSYPSFFRLYIMPTLTAEIGFALCFGDYASTLSLQDPMGSVGGNCVVFTVPIPCGKKSDEESPDETLPSNVLAQYADIKSCEETTNTPTFSQNQSNSCIQLAASSNGSNMDIAAPAADGNGGVNPSYNNGSYLGGFITIDKKPSTAIGYGSDQSPISIEIDGVELIGGAGEKNKILGSAVKGLIEKIGKAWLDKQLKYTLNNLTNFYIGITWPDLSILTEGWASLGDSFKSAISDQYGSKEDREECKKQNGTFINGTCITEQQKCVNKGKQWLNGSCVEKASKTANDQGLDGLSNLLQSKRVSQEQISEAGESNFANPLAFLETAFQDVPLINITTEDLTVNVPMITNEDIISYVATSQNWLNRQQQILQEWKDLIFGILSICGGRKISDVSELKDAVNELTDQLVNDLKNSISELENDVKGLKEQIKKAASGEEKAALQSELNQKESQLNELLVYQNQINAQDKLNEKYDLTKLGSYALLERQNGDFLIELPNYSLDVEILSTPLYLLYDLSKNEIKPFTQGIELVKNTSGKKIQITGIKKKTNGPKIENGDLNLKKITPKGEQNQCASIFIGGSFNVAIDGFLSIEANANDLIQSVKQNIETLDLYRKFPSQLYEWIHVADIYLGEISSFINSFLGTLSMWMNTNATRYSQYVNAIISIMTAIETFQAIPDLAVNFNQKCSTCSNDNYDQFTCKLGLICPDDLLPTIPIPPMKIPSIYLDFSNINLGTDIKLPNFHFKTVSIDLPKLPDIPTPPNIDIDLDSLGELGISEALDSILNLLNLDINLNLNGIPLIPSPPQLPNLPDLNIEADISLPLLPPAPKIPQIPTEISTVIDAAEVISDILCLVKRLPLVGETSVKAKIEQLSERTYEVPYRDTMDQTLSHLGDQITSSAASAILKKFMPFITAAEFKDVDLKGFDLNLESYINLQLNFDEFYDVVKDMVDQVNEFTGKPMDYLETMTNNLSQWTSNVSTDLQKCISNPLEYRECLEILGDEGINLVNSFVEIKDRLNTMKTYLKDGFKDISIYKQELVNLGNNITHTEESINDVNEVISQLDQYIAITKTQIQMETSELKKATLSSNLNVYNKHKNSINQELLGLQDELEALQSKYEILSNKYGPDIERYNTAMEAYNSLYEEYQVISEQVNEAKEFIVDSLAKGQNAISNGIDTALDKVGEVGSSLQSDTESFEQKQQLLRDQRFENLQNMYDDGVDSLSYNQYDYELYDEETIINNKKILTDAISQIKSKSDDSALNRKLDGYLALLQSDANIYPANDSITSIQKEYTTILNKYKEDTDNLGDTILNDYDQFLYAVANNDKKLVKNDDIQITLSENLFNIDRSVKDKLLNSENIYKMYLDYYDKNVDGYLNALDNYSAQDLNMSDAVYQLNKKYLYDIKEKTELAYEKIEADEKKILLAQNSSGGGGNGGSSYGSSSASSTNSTTNNVNISTYFAGQIISTPEGGFMLANPDFTKEFQDQSIMVDINKDGKNDLILWDDHEIYIKYRDSDTSFDNTSYNNKYYVYPISSYDDLVNNSNDCVVRINNMNIKLCDINWEVKNFKYAGSDFDTITVSRSNSEKLGDTVAGYLVKLIHRVDLFDDKEQIVNNSNRATFDKKYIVVLPKGTDTTNMKIRLEDGSTVDIESDDIFDIQYFNEISDIIDLTITEIPRNWQYAEIYTLDMVGGKYITNSSTSNQIVGGPQIIADSIGPDAEIDLYRPATDTVVDDGEVFEGYVSTNYTLRSNWKDNALLDSIWITDEDGIILDKKEHIFQKTGYIELSNLFFTGVGVHHYYLVGDDINGNSTSIDVTLTIKTPNISIVDISKQLTGQALSSNIPVSIVAEINQDLDEGIVQFLRKRNNIWELMTGVLGGIRSDKYNLVPNQTIITGGYFDFGDDIGLYLSNGDLAAKLTPDNGQIVVQPGYESKVSIEVDYANHTPIIKVIENNQDILMILQLTSEQLLDINVYDNLVVQELDGNQFGTFNGGKAIIQNNEILLYVSPKGDIYTDHYLYGDYKFDTNDNAVIYTFKKTKKGQALGNIKVKVQNVLQK